MFFIVTCLDTVVYETILAYQNRENKGMARSTFLKPTHINVINKIYELEINVKIKTESQAEDIIYEYLRNSFEIVARQYHLAGFRGQKIDIDIGRGSVGIEIKLAKSLLGNVGEIYRCIGQAIVYINKGYIESLIIAIVGTHDEIKHHEIDELTDILAENGASFAMIKCI